MARTMCFSTALTEMPRWAAMSRNLHPSSLRSMNTVRVRSGRRNKTIVAACKSSSALQETFRIDLVLAMHFRIEGDLKPGRMG